MNVKVSEIFTSAGKAFNSLGDLIFQLQAGTESNSKWSQEEVDMLKNSVTKFNEDLNSLSSHIKNKQTNQIRQTLKQKSFKQVGMVTKVENVRPTTAIQITQQQNLPQQQIVIKDSSQIIYQPQSNIKIEQKLPDCNLIQVSPTPTSSQMTLNQLNVHQQEEVEMDVGDFQTEDEKIEYVSTSEVS